MAATDYETTIYRAIKALLEGHAPLMVTTTSATYIRPGNRIWWDGSRQVPIKTAKAPADFYELELAPAGKTIEFFSSTGRYAYTANVNPANLGNNERRDYTFVLTLTHPGLAIALDNPVEAEVETALRKGNPRLGLPYVQRWGPASAVREAGVTETSGNAYRLRTVYTIPVVTVVNTASLQ